MSTTADFDTLAPSPADSHTKCACCKIGLDNCYYQANQVTLCPNCATAVEQGRAPAGSRFVRVAKALVLGSLAAAAGAAVQFAVLHFLNLNAAIVTIFMGIMVGGAVRAGSGHRGGWRYQIMAVLLTYMAIAAAYVPQALAEIKTSEDAKQAGAPLSANAHGAAVHGMLPPAKAAPAQDAAMEKATLAQLPVLLAIVALGFLALPIGVGISSPVSLLIFGFGLYRAWVMNKATPVEVTGPHWLHTPQAPPFPA